ncbi:Calcium-binding mitochondrial carrier protein SCaMC-1 [Hondaea fermentalgiana]|uniref:Calcium-binding mitochondrial carrier protein SCaMC-1 n=1 Tax=Hondaea fermentalgiana TaxID=2315210 RepID=A0A2R5G3G9_9STRA|nr:Calcium-binding mitochondrial carrier protein SCaMC-1 [Hondaea fermentalgiana]|eukprot:GBG25586.1 Calcium-binding mitochondrial carrier protein SCaMC-1 [Hondaea fermentalgiana]
MDRNKDGRIVPEELKRSLLDLQLKASDGQIDKIVRRMSRVDTSDVRFGEFRKFLLLLPGNSLRHVFDSWAKDSSVDVGLGEDFGVPDEVEGGKPAYLVNFIAGGVAGAVSRTLTAPLDRLKVLMMTGNVSGRTITQGLRSIYKEGGFVAFYRGNGSNVVKIIPESAMKFFTYERLKNEIAEDPDNIRIRERFIAGAGAGIVSQTLIYPLEIAKTRLAVAKKGEYRGIFHCLNRTVRYEGVRALYRGLGASLAGVAPYAGIDLMVFMTLKESWIRAHPHEVDGPGALTLLLFGATSSTIGATVAYPLQLIRTKLQAQGMNASMPVTYSGPLDCFHKTIRDNGVRGLYRGLLPNLLKTLPAVATSYLVYEETRKALS